MKQICLRGIICSLAAGTKALRPDSTQQSAEGLLGSHFGIPGRDACYDYIVIGGGTAGLAIAHRLAQNSTDGVAVVEAGDFYQFSSGNYSEVPAYASYFTGDDPKQKNSYLDWYHYTETQPQLKNRKSLYDSGKGIGGTSGRNFLWQVRGSRGAFDRWADEVEDKTYRFDNFLPYFQRSAQFTPPDNHQRHGNATVQFNASDWSPKGGPMHVGYSSWVNPMSSWLIAAFRDLGLKDLPSLLSGNLLGWSWLAVNIDPSTQTRSSSTDFLTEAFLENSNLVVYKNTLAKRIMFEDYRATAVKVTAGAATFEIKARKEVILSAGVVLSFPGSFALESTHVCCQMRSPQLLMVSGIGPRKVLVNHGVDVVSERAGVGQNMWDVVAVGPTYSISVVTHSSLTDPKFLTDAVEQYNANRSGILTNLGGDLAGTVKSLVSLIAIIRCSCEGTSGIFVLRVGMFCLQQLRFFRVGFEKFTNTTLDKSTYQSLQDSFPDDWPHIVYLVLDAYFGTGSGNIPADLDITKQYAAASVGLVATFSRGNVTINSTDTTDDPVISPNLLSDPRDLDMAVAAFQRGRQLFQTSGISPIVRGEVYPGGNLSTGAEIIEIIRSSAVPIYNAVGTNKMGRRNDPLAVVDSEARVIGVKGLRVVDASIFPFLPTSQPCATICEFYTVVFILRCGAELQSGIDALAEKIADGIRQGF
ncbi:MAG: hypothetical protein Q9180_000405 [Flavoplaca navasiana]